MSIRSGAEAVIESVGGARVAKRRMVKAYRHPELDLRLRKRRTKDEAALLIAARRAGVRVPVVYDVDLEGCTITMEQVEGGALRETWREATHDRRLVLCRAVADDLARLHAAGIAHGDVTPANILVAEGLVWIDFGLGSLGAADEDKGIDLHLFEEALRATESDAEGLIDAFLAAYRARGQAAALTRLQAIRERGRYR